MGGIEKNKAGMRSSEFSVGARLKSWDAAHAVTQTPAFRGLHVGCSV